MRIGPTDKYAANEPLFQTEHERWISELIDQRDRAEEMADAMAEQIGILLGVDIGEHSNLNCPWENALAAIRGRNAT